MKLSSTQRDALAQLAQGHFVPTRAGWCLPDSGGLNAFSTLTVASLARQGLVAITERGTHRARARITKAGREVLAKAQEPAQ